MGATKGPYRAEFAVGSLVRVADRRTLERFVAEWKFHHPLDPSNARFAGLRAKVANVGFYHGGDELYELEGFPGLWHESYLKADS